MRAFTCLALTVSLVAFSTAAAQYFEHDPDDSTQNAPIREGEKAVIPLDTNDPAYNIWQTPRPDLMKGREPGPINIQRFIGGPGFAGIPTFFKLPIALTPEDLKAGNVDVAIVGAYIDMGFGGRGAAMGPHGVPSFPQHGRLGCICNGPHADPREPVRRVDDGRLW